MHKVSYAVDYIATAMICVVLLLLLVWHICVNRPDPKPKTSKQTNERIATLEREVQELRASKE